MGREKRALAVGLTVAFLLATLMGAGPGVYLINPDPADPGSRFLLAGVPIVYAWGLFWYAVQLGVVLVAYFCLWTRDDTKRNGFDHDSGAPEGGRGGID